MNFLLFLLIVAAQPAAPTDLPADARHPGAVEIFHCDFEEAADQDVDGWPDGWSRMRGPNFPAYLPIKIDDAGAAEGRFALRMGLNGGGAVIYSPPIKVGSLFSYVLEAQLKTEGLKQDRAFLTLTFYDAKRKELETFTSERIQEAKNWIKLRLGPLASTNDEAYTAIIGLHLEPESGLADLRGAALFDDIWLARLPRLRLTTNHASVIYTLGNPIDISCKVSGIFESDPTLRCELFDLNNQLVGEADVRKLQSSSSFLPSPLKPDALTKDKNKDDDFPNIFLGATQWKPKVTQPGFYRLRVSLEENAVTKLDHYLSLAVIEPLASLPNGEFGWVLPQGDQALSYAALAEILPQMGIHWLKLPIWLSGKELTNIEELVHFAERLGLQGIESVGLLANPPADLQPQLEKNALGSAATIFSSQAELWINALEPVITRLSAQMHWWQLGDDGDVSFIGDPDLEQRIESVRKELEKFDHNAHLGFSWRLLNEPPHDKHPAWDFVSYTANPPMTDQELDQYLPAIPSQPTRGWVVLDPLPKNDYAMEDRAADLVRRMVLAKRHGEQAIFVSNPFDPQCGLMNQDGTPGELLLPWRTTALFLGGAEYLGSISLSEGSKNHIFLRDNEVVMVAWNQQTVQEKIFSGLNPRQVDPWGQSNKLSQEGNNFVATVGPVPTFIVGISEPIVRWSMNFAFEKSEIPSVVGKSHENSLHLKNFFPQGVMGQVRLKTPDTWHASPQVINFKLAAGEETHEPFAIRLLGGAVSGRYPVRIDFDIKADRDYRFSLFRDIELGLDSVIIEMTSHLNADGTLEIEQYLTNKTNETLSFRCLLYVPDRRRIVSQVTRIGPDRDVKRYYLPNGKELIGREISLRFEEINGERTYHYRFTAKE